MRRKRSFDSRRIVITGAPGSGKTTLTNVLHKRGFPIYPEAARIVINEELDKADPTLPWKDRKQFDQLIIPKMIAWYEAGGAYRVAIYDRGLPDLVGWAIYENCEFQNYLELNSRFRYESPVLFSQPRSRWYERDRTRPFTYKEAVYLNDCLQQGYHLCGYEIENIPKVEAEEAAEWIIKYCVL